jgi:hypothetical protein
MLFVTKVFDTDCEICKHMSKHDRATYESFPEVNYDELALDDVINHDNNLTKMRIYQCLELYALNTDYTVDLPVYVYLSKEGQYKGHHIGAATIGEIRDKTNDILTESS